MGIFEPEEPKIDKRKMKDVVMHDLYRKGFKPVERDEVDKIFLGDYDQTSLHPDEHGIKRGEARARIEWMKENPSKHILTKDKIKSLEEVIDKHLPGEITDSEEPKK